MSSTEGVRTVYQKVWRCLVLLAAAAGVVVAVAAWTPGGALTIVVVVGANAAFIAHAWRSEGRTRRWQESVQTGLASGALALGACGLAMWLGRQGLLIVALLALFSPTVVTAALRRRRADVSERGPGPRPLPHHDRVEAPWMTRPTTAMDDTSLCLAWRVSFVALRHPVSLPFRQQVVDRRRELLDELERRNPGGFQEWLASGARAASDPTKYIAPVQRDVNRHDPR